MSEQLTPRQVLEQEFYSYVKTWDWSPEAPKWEDVSQEHDSLNFVHTAMVRWGRICATRQRNNYFQAVHDFVNDMMDWAAVTFPKSTTESCLTHLEQEIKEVKFSLLWEGNDKEKKEEIADCFILLMQAAKREGFEFKDIFEAAQAKMVVNKSRQWGTPDENGVVNHVKE